MPEATNDISGLQCLQLLLRYHQVAVDPEQIRHQFGGVTIGVTEMLRCAKELKLKARAEVLSWDRLARMALLN